MDRKGNPILIKRFLELANASSENDIKTTFRQLLEALIQRSITGVRKGKRKLNLAALTSINSIPQSWFYLDYKQILDTKDKLKIIISKLVEVSEASQLLNDSSASVEDRRQAAQILKNTTIDIPTWTTPRQLQFGREGQITRKAVEPDIWRYLIEALEELSSVNKIRQCKVCEKYFYTHHKNRKTCSPAHANTWRQRLYYNRHHRIPLKKESLSTESH